MWFRFRLVGSGRPDDPHRVNLPTYNGLRGNITTREAIVSLPEEVHGLTRDDLSTETIHQTTEGDLVVSLSDANLKKLHDHIDEHYPQSKGKFRVENV